jgi:transposase
LVDTSIVSEEVAMVRQPFRKRKHTPEFKVEAVRLMHERIASGLTLQRVSEELAVNPDQLRRWAQLLAAAPRESSPAEVFPGHGRRRAYRPADRPRDDGRTAIPGAAGESPEEELRRLRRENERLRLERDFLKKATAFFAKESP